MIQYHTAPGSSVIEISVEGKITDHELREAIGRMHGDLELNGKTRSSSALSISAASNQRRCEPT